MERLELLVARPALGLPQAVDAGPATGAGAGGAGGAVAAAAAAAAAATAVLVSSWLSTVVDADIFHTEGLHACPQTT